MSVQKEGKNRISVYPQISPPRYILITLGNMGRSCGKIQQSPTSPCVQGQHSYKDKWTSPNPRYYTLWRCEMFSLEFLSKMHNLTQIRRKYQKRTRRWWLTPVILAIQEVEIRKIVIQVQPRQIVCQTYLKNTQHKNETKMSTVSILIPHSVRIPS
jgi:hypothetical protein